MASFRLVLAFLPLIFVQILAGKDTRALMMGKDELGYWWPVTVASENPNDDTVSCIVHDEAGSIWPTVHRENLKMGTNQVMSWLYENINETDFEDPKQFATDWWRYNPCNGKPVAIREVADVRGKKTSSIVQPGEVFEVDGAHMDAEGILHLRLADGRGWLFDKIPGGCTVCFPAGGPQPQWWRYVPFNGKRMSVREGFGPNAKRTNKMVQPGEAFQVDAGQADEQGVMHLRLADGSGWLFDRTQDGMLCSLIEG